MIDKSLIEPEVDILIDDFQKSFPDSKLLSDSLVRQNLIGQINFCFNEQRVTQEFEDWIHQKIAAAINCFPIIQDNQARLFGEEYTDFMIRKWGSEVGSFFCLVNRTIHRVAQAAANAFNKRLEQHDNN